MAIIGGIALLTGNTPSFMGLWTVTSILQVYVSAFVSFLTAPMEGILVALIYFNQKIKKDGLDIEIGLERLTRMVQVRNG